MPHEIRRPHRLQRFSVPLLCSVCYTRDRQQRLNPVAEVATNLVHAGCRGQPGIVDTSRRLFQSIKR